MSNNLSEIPEEISEDLFSIPHPIRSLWGILISTFFLRVAFGSTTVLMPIFIYYHLQMEGANADLSIIVVEITYAIAVIVSSGFFGFKSDATDARKWILFGTAAGGLILAGYGFCALNWQGWIGIIPLANGLLIFGMSLFHFLHGIAGSSKVNSSYGYLSRFSVYENRGRRIGFYNVAVTGGRSVGVVLAGTLYDLIVQPQETASSWEPLYPQRLVYLYLLFAFAIVISAVLVYFLVDKTKSMIKDEDYNLKQELLTSWKLMTNKNRRGIVLPLLGVASIIGILNNWAFLVLSIETSPGTAGLTTIAITLAMGIPMTLWGWVADKIGRRKTLWIGVSGLIFMLGCLLLAFFGNFLTGGQPWYSPSAQFNTSGFLDNIWLLILIILALFIGSAYFPAISGRLGDSSSIGLKEERHGSTMSIQQTIMSVSEIIGIILGGLALMVVSIAFETDTNFAYNMIGLLVPIVALLILTTIASFLWPEEGEFLEKVKVRRRTEN
ncbi:MAG: MFS transporter [Candidatus Heimdallarchaeaceae archaeon]|jgi:MFS family permease